MNCKPGDLAIIVRAHGKSLGRIVRCLRLDKRRSSMPLTGPNEVWDARAVWEIDEEIPGWNGTMIGYAPDCCLRPIRDPGDDAVDESLSWLPVPTTQREKETA